MSRPSFERYFQNELTYLRDMGRSFGQAHPALAGMLVERGGDPDVERLLEGFAFVAARMRQRIDDAIPELVEPLLQLLMPHFLRPTPAASIVEFSAPEGLLRGCQTIPMRTRLASRPVRGGVCHFWTSRPLDVLPVRIESQALDERSPSSPELRVRLACDTGAGPAVLGHDTLRFHLHGPLGVSAHLLLWLMRHCVGVTLACGGGRDFELGPGAVVLPSLSNDDTLFPWPSFSPHGPRLVHEYFTLPAKFLFFDVKGLRRAGGLVSDQFELRFRFLRPPPLPARVPDDVLRLHAVPVVNLFSATAEPVRVDVEGRPTLLRALGMDPMHNEVFDVQSVTGSSPAYRGVQAYPPFHSFEHTRSARAHQGFYTISRESSPVDDGLHAYLTRGAARGSAAALDDETLSVELLCTNRGLPTELQMGDLCVPTSETPAGLAFRNIAPVSRPQRPPLDGELTWQLVAQLASQRRGLGDAASVRAFLSLYNWQERADHPTGRANRARIEALRGVSTTTITRALRGAAVRGVLYRLDLERAAFESEGDAFLFGAILDAWFSSHAPVNTFTELELKLIPSNWSVRYIPRERL